MVLNILLINFFLSCLFNLIHVQSIFPFLFVNTFPHLLEYLVFYSENVHIEDVFFWIAAPSNLVEVYRRFRDAVTIIRTKSTSETSINLHETSRLNNPEDSHLHTRCREDLKSHNVMIDTGHKASFVQKIIPVS
jgi:hypothetical protein